MNVGGLGVVLLLLFVASPAAHAGSGLGFYIPPAPLPAGQPGDLVRSEPAVARLVGVRLPGVRAWRILFRSTSATGGEIAVSGTVLVPAAGTSRRRPLVALAPGTQGLGDQCAPSRLLTGGGALYETPVVIGLLARGWAVVIPDYEGLGTPGQHTYVVGRSEGHATLDALRAARRVTEAALPLDGPLAITGYSQGGQAAAWAAEQQAEYAPELEIAAIAAGGVPALPGPVVAGVDGGIFSGLLLHAMLGFDAAYPELDLERFLNATGVRVFEASRNQCGIQTFLQQPFRRIADVTTSNPLDTPAWRARMAENTLGEGRPASPTLLYHGRTDTLVAYPQAEQLRARWCARGAALRWRSFWGEHVGTYLGAQASVQSWLAARLAGRSEAGNCPG